MATPVPTPSYVELLPGPRRGWETWKSGLGPSPVSELQRRGTWIGMMGKTPQLQRAALLRTQGSVLGLSPQRSIPAIPAWLPITYLHVMLHHRVQHLQVSQKLPKEGDTLGKQSKSGMNPCSQVSSQTLPSEPATLSPGPPQGSHKDR